MRNLFDNPLLLIALIAVPGVLLGALVVLYGRLRTRKDRHQDGGSDLPR